MLRFGVYVLFVLACVLPGWYLRDIAAAEAQMSADYLPILHGEPDGCEEDGDFPWRRRLGRRGQECLWHMIREGNDTPRRDRACNALLLYENPTVARWAVESLARGDRSTWMWSDWWTQNHAFSEDLRIVFAAIGDEEFLNVLRHVSDHYRRGDLLGRMRDVQPLVAQCAAMRWIQEADDLRELDSAIAANRAGLRNLAGVDAKAKRQERKHRERELLTAGLQNPNEEIRVSCRQALLELDRFYEDLR